MGSNSRAGKKAIAGGRTGSGSRQSGRKLSAQFGRRAAAVDGALKNANLKRLRRIEGQVRGLQKMVNDERYCADVLVQIASVHEALRGVGRALLRNHLRHCATTAIVSGSPADAEAMYDELTELFYKYSR